MKNHRQGFWPEEQKNGRCPELREGSLDRRGGGEGDDEKFSPHPDVCLLDTRVKTGSWQWDSLVWCSGGWSAGDPNVRIIKSHNSVVQLKLQPEVKFLKGPRFSKRPLS